MGLSLKASITTFFTALAMVGVVANASAQELNETNPTGQFPVGYCDSDCNSNLAGLGKIAKAIIDADRKKHGEHDSGYILYTVDDPNMDDVHYDIFLAENSIVTEESVLPENAI